MLAHRIQTGLPPSADFPSGGRRGTSHMKLFSLLALTLAVAHGGAAAQDIPERTWSTSAELGAITTTGNTVGTSVTGKIDARQELDNWSNEYILSLSLIHI